LLLPVAERHDGRRLINIGERGRIETESSHSRRAARRGNRHGDRKATVRSARTPASRECYPNGFCDFKTSG
jgi:hypothetical protein